MGRPFSPERLMLIRRMRRARRLHKQVPLFAFALMQQEYPEYTFSDFYSDLRLRSKPKRRKGKSPLVRFGRYWRIQELISRFHATGDYDLLRRANKLRAQLTKPYRVLVKLKGEAIEYTFSPLIPIGRMEQLMQKFKGCETEQQVDAVIAEFNKNNHLR